MFKTDLLSFGLHGDRASCWMEIQRTNVETVTPDEGAAVQIPRIVGHQRETLYPHRGLASQLATVNEALERDGFPSLTAEDIARLTDFVAEERAAGRLTDPPEPSEPEPEVPQAVSRFQARAALMLAGKLDAVQAAIDASADPLVKLAWTEAVEFRRDSPTIAAIADVLGMTSHEIDDLFRQAAAIVA